MTGYTVHTGTSKKFVAGWDRVFSESKANGKSAAGRKTKARKGAGKSKSRKDG